jgi:hypothetical protein
MWFVINAPHFYAATGAPIIKYMDDWSEEKIREYCKKKEWEVIEMLDPYEAYQLNNALHLHFFSKYDAFKYNFRVKVGNVESFKNKPSANWYNNIVKRYSVRPELRDFYLANYIAGERWGGMHAAACHDNYVEWLKRTQSLTYNFEQELANLQDTYFKEDIQLSDLFLSKGTEKWPWIFWIYIHQKAVSIETLALVDNLTDFIVKSNDWIGSKLLWDKETFKIKKYEPFLKFDRDTAKQILLQYFPLELGNG